MIMGKFTRGTLNSACSVLFRPLVGVRDCVPSQQVPVNPDLKLCGSICTRKLPLPTLENRKSPCASVVVVAAVPPSAATRLSWSPGRPTSSGWTTPRTLGLAGEKSRQTRPVMSFCDEAGSIAGCAPRVDRIVGLMPINPSSTVSPAETEVVLTRFPPVPGVTPLEARRATVWPVELSIGYRPGGLNQSLAV